MNNAPMVRLRKNGNYWQAAWIDEAGRRVVRSLGPMRIRDRRAGGYKPALTKREAEQACANIAADIKRHSAQGGGTVGDLVARFLDARPGLADRVRLLYESTGRYLVEHFGPSAQVQKITSAQAHDWHARLSKGELASAHARAVGKPSDATVCCHVRNCKAMWNWLIDRREVGDNPFAALRGTAHATEVGRLDLTEADILRLVDSSPTPQWRCLIGLCAFAGLRYNEARALTWDDIHWERNRLIACAQAKKVTTKHKRREVMLEPALARILLDAREAVDGQPADVGKADQHRTMVAIIQRAGLEPWSKPFHALRGWRDSTWKLKYPEYVVDAWLGHSLEVSRRHYLAVPEDIYASAQAACAAG